MVHINELYITEDTQKLIVDISISSESYYEKVFLDSIVIDTQDTYISSGPSSTPIYAKEFDGDYKHKRIILTPSDIGISLDKMFFIYIRTKGTPAADTPCGMDNIITMATVVNMYPFYQQAMEYINELGQDCKAPQGFTDFILRLKALELSVRTGNYQKAIEYFNRFFNGKSNVVKKGGCGCGGS